MAAALHYLVKVKLIRYKANDNIDFIKYDKVFENENPILARQDAFKEYEEWIKDLYMGMNQSDGYISDRQSRIDLQKYIISSHKQDIQIDDNEINFGNSVGFGIGVYLIIDKAYHEGWESEDMYDKEGDEHLLHGIGSSDKYNDPLEISDALNTEILYYEHYNYDKSNFIRNARIYDWDKPGIDEIHFLETPFDWTGFDKVPEEETNATKQYRVQGIEEIIANGEGNQVEFKPALLYNFKTGKGGISVKGKIATAICAFLNSNGGILFIGLDDDGRPQGLEYDFSLSNGKKSKDFFQNEFDQMLEHFLSFSIKANVNAEFFQLNGRDIFMVAIEPSKNRPIFVKGQNGKEFWVRGNAGNRQLIDMEELVNYCIDRWTK